jgi:hypothetical protein
MSRLMQEGGAFAFLSGEPELYTDSDLVERNQ